MRVATMLLLVLAGAGCALESGAPGEQAAAVDVSTGLVECDEYVRAYLACGPKAAVQGRALIEGFRRMALDPKVADAARSSCRQASSALKQSTECKKGAGEQ